MLPLLGGKCQGHFGTLPEGLELWSINPPTKNDRPYLPSNISPTSTKWYSSFVYNSDKISTNSDIKTIFLVPHILNSDSTTYQMHPISVQFALNLMWSVTFSTRDTTCVWTRRNPNSSGIQTKVSQSLKLHVFASVCWFVRSITQDDMERFQERREMANRKEAWF